MRLTDFFGCVLGITSLIVVIPIILIGDLIQWFG